MKRIKLMGISVLLVLTAFAFTGCDGLLITTEYVDVEVEVEVEVEVLATPNGRVIDGKTAFGIADAIVTLTNVDGSYNVTTTSTGAYDFSTAVLKPGFGDYELTVEKTGYAFTPLQVSLSSTDQAFDTVVGVLSTSDGLLFVLMWDDGATLDVDAYMTYPNSAATSPINSSDSTAYEAYVSDISGYGAGFVPELGVASRAKVYYGNRESSIDNEIVLDVDDQDGTGPETISVSWTTPWTPGDTATFAPSAITDLNTTDIAPVVWAGTLEYYVNGYSDQLSTLGSYVGAHPVLYIFSGADCIGIYDVPDYTNIGTASLARIQVFNDLLTNQAYYFAIYPDIRLLPGGTSDIRSISTGEYAPLIVSRR